MICGGEDLGTDIFLKRPSVIFQGRKSVDRLTWKEAFFVRFLS